MNFTDEELEAAADFLKYCLRDGSWKPEITTRELLVSVHNAMRKDLQKRECEKIALRIRADYREMSPDQRKDFLYWIAQVGSGVVAVDSDGGLEPYLDMEGIEYTHLQDEEAS